MPSRISDRFSSQRAACKQWSAGLGVLILLIGALAGLNPTKMLWAAGPLLLLGLVEAGYAAQERRYAELLKAPSTGSGQAPSAGSGRGVLLPEPAGASVVRTMFAALSLSIWPFYLGLFAIVGIGGEEMAASNKKVLATNGPPANYAPAGMMRPVAANGVGLGPSTSLRAGPSTSLGAGCGSGGCGTSAGCGSGGCGASAGQGCSCSGGAAPAQQMKRPVQPYMQTANGPMAYQQMNLESRKAGNSGVINGGYPQMPPPAPMAPQGVQMPQQGQYQRPPNGAIANPRPPNLAPAAGQPAAAVVPPAAVADAPLQNAVSTPAPAPVAIPATPDAASKKKH